MGGRGSRSATGSSGGKMVLVPAGGYPERLKSLIDADGHISLNADDYSGYTRDEIAAFLSALPYESAMVFSPDGKLVYIHSDWEKSYCTINGFKHHKAIVEFENGGEALSGYEDLHIHPLSAGEREYPTIFSGADIGHVNSSLNWSKGASGILRGPDKFTIVAWNGGEFSLEYDTSKQTRNRSDFKKAYKSQYTKVSKKVGKDMALSGKPWSDKIVSERITAEMDAYLKAKAPLYGLKYTSNL